ECDRARGELRHREDDAPPGAPRRETHYADVLGDRGPQVGGGRPVVERAGARHHATQLGERRAALAARREVPLERRALRGPQLAVQVLAQSIRPLVLHRSPRSFSARDACAAPCARDAAAISTCPRRSPACRRSPRGDRPRCRATRTPGAPRRAAGPSLARSRPTAPPPPPAGSAPPPARPP